MAGPRRRTDDWALRPFSGELWKSQPHIFSPFLWTHLFLLTGLGASGKDSAPTVAAGILGGVVTLSLNISVDTDIEHVTWIASQKALALAYPNGAVIIMDKSYQDRLNISWNYLSISNLMLKDAGPYHAQINRRNSGVTMDEEFTLQIYERLQEPRVTVQTMNVSENASCNITLTCSVEGAEKAVQYSWTPRDPHASESSWGSTLTISWTPCDPDLQYTCTAKNPVSQSSSRPVDLRTWQICIDPGASRGGSVGETVVGILGESVTLPLALPASQDIENVVWMFNTSVISKEWGEAAKADPEKNTAWVSQDYSLKIGQLRMEDAGPYHAYICSKASGVISMKHVTLLIYRSAPAFSSSQVEASADTSGSTAGRTIYSMLSPGYEMMDTLPKTSRQQGRPTSESSSDSNGTTDEDEEKNEMYRPVNKRDQVYDSVTQEDTEHDSASEGQAEYDLVTPDDVQPEPVVDGNTVYMEVFLNSQGETPVPLKKDSSDTIYSQIQKSQTVVPPTQQNNFDSPEISTYENLT
uniref:Lymphocyte antigen 9 n=1 Tax=Equus caballus TaxID=9796 RepID=A0A9L0TUR9_HORSE